EIKDIDPPKDLVESMGRQMKAEREKRAAILEAEGRRQAAILQAEGAKQAQVLEAEGRKEAAFRDAEARERSAEAEAKATQMVSDAIASGSVQAINYFVANNYIEALGKIATSPNQKVLMLPVEAASVIGSIGGIAEIAREAFGGTAPTRPGRPPSAGQWCGRQRQMQVIQSIRSAGPWAWIVGGLVLLALELVLPGGFLLWMGISGVITGLIVLFQPIGWPLQWLIFGVLSLVSIALWVRWSRSRPTPTDRPELNERASRYVGHE